MIGIIPFRLSTDAQAPVWTSTDWAAFMNPSQEFSLAHFWHRSTFGLADLTYKLFEPVTIVDPRPGMTEEELKADHEGRSRRTKAIVQAVDDAYHPTWDDYAVLMLWCASPFDLWGSSAQDHGHGTCGVFTCSAFNWFDDLCHELGHALGFGHPFGRGGEYDSPFDIMGGHDSAWWRGVVAGVPAGHTAPAGGTDPLRHVGPLLSAAQLSMSGYAAQLPGVLVERAPLSDTETTTVTLHALDRAIDSWPQQALPAALSLTTPDWRYVLELRRATGYDGGVRSAVVVHAFDPRIWRFDFVGALTLDDDRGDRDLHVFSSGKGGDFTVRLLEVGAGDAWARIRVGGPDYWRNFGVDLAISTVPRATDHSAWQTTLVRPCLFASLDDHSFRYVSTRESFLIEATSFGYERPHYEWRLAGHTLATSLSGRVTVSASVSVPNPSGPWGSVQRDLVFTFLAVGPRLELLLREDDLLSIGRFSVPLEVTVAETSPEVVKNVYPDRTVATSLAWEVTTIEWDAAYEAGLRRCRQVVDEVERKRIPIPLPSLGPKGLAVDRTLPSVMDVLDGLLESNPAAANAIIEQVGKSGGPSPLELVAELQKRRQA
ncbi:hypothetical protein [Granulicoccus sp. GXG6511]|uniref:hypothetical protein n=1 Tax=Granulicoccus sp. GXG6511 TaxID=3381351 RepID=UPI003D7E4EA5